MKLPSTVANGNNLRRLGLLNIFVGLAAVFVFAGLAHADTIVRGFSTTDKSLAPGYLVALTKAGGNSVQAAPGNNSSEIYGVVIDPSLAPVTLQVQLNQKVFVATSGTYPVLVNTENGPINPGDYISISPVNGIAGKATNKQSNILGQALQKFDGKNGVITSGPDGSSIGRIEATILPGRNPLVKSDVAIPTTLKRFGDTIAGKDISALRIYAALAIFLATAIMAVSVLTVGVRSGIIAIGRNPLSRHSIMSGLRKVVAVAVVVFIIGLAAVYLLLRI